MRPHLIGAFGLLLACAGGAADDDRGVVPRRPIGTARAAPVTLGTQSEALPLQAVEAEPDVREVAPRWEPEPTDPREAEHPIEDFSGRSLAAFYEALARTDDAEPGAADALTRVVHMGDSSIGMDQLPHYLRQPFQERFGDGGSGFVLVQPHSTSYRNQTVQISTPTPWEFCFIIFQCLRDGHYGLGGVAAKSHGGATTVIRTQRGRTASRVELWYAGMPRGGRLELRVDRDAPVLIETEAPALESRWHELRVPAGPHSVQVRAVGGPVRAYGVVLENDGPGVVWDTLSMIGAFTPRLLDHDETHFREQLARRHPSLVILGYGGNDLRRFAGRGVPAEQLKDETKALLERVRSAGEDVSCLLTGVVEHELSGQVQITSTDVEALVEAQRAAAREAGCAYFDVYRAMGGAGSYRAWLRRGLAADDGKHLSPAGRRIIARYMHDALMSGYVAYRQAR